MLMKFTLPGSEMAQEAFSDVDKHSEVIWRSWKPVNKIFFPSSQKNILNSHWIHLGLGQW